MTTGTYLGVMALVFLAAFIIFRVFVRRDYKQKGHLTFFSASLQWIIFFLWSFSAWLDTPPAGIWPPAFFREILPVLQIIGLIFGIVGVGGVISLMIWFGMRRTSGTEVNTLVRKGPYRWTRNPQLVIGGIGVLGYLIAWPSWHAVGWFFLFVVIAHLMIITEEEHLAKVSGEEYRRYCKEVPRYLGFSVQNRN